MPVSSFNAGYPAGALGSGISVPRFSDYAPRLVEFVRAHPEIGAAGMA